MSRRILCLALCSILTILVLFAGCGSPENDSSNWPVEIAGVEIDKTPEKVVCLSNNFTEIACQLGYSSQITGRAYDCDYYQVAAVTPCGTIDTPSVDVIKNLAPDVILTDHRTPLEVFDEFSKTDLSNTDIIVLEDAYSRASLIELYEDLGSIFGGSVAGKAKGREIIEGILIELDDIARLTSKEEEVSVCVVLDDAASSCATGDTLTEMLITMAGGFNAATDGTGKSFDVADIKKADPDILICPKTGLSAMYAKRTLQEVPAMQNQKLYGFDVSLLDVQCYDMIEVVWRMAHILHPDIITEDVMPAEYVDHEEPDPHFWDNDEDFQDYLSSQAELDKEEEEE